MRLKLNTLLSQGLVIFERKVVERESSSVNSRRHFCYGGGEVLVSDSSEFVEGSVNVEHSICILIFCSSDCEFKYFEAFVYSFWSS
ncbi:hypothetical protein L1987_81267 [Smallanthus sonchifolius]|uniref:Uncharacterized protein n=1 Tax=Smallanthus sonchifolius TaxID=185202 RepID=A0ACB8YQL3_9ASTR|nr:hypothetical protein L1987_81267 [Smallanthus sonchifolius]